MRQTRQGISLLEVLISMGVLLFGLLGAAALLPVGQHYISKASRFDRASALGQAALEELKTRGMLRPHFNNWLRADGTAFAPGSTLISSRPETIPLVASDMRGIAFAIDPLACAMNATASPVWSFPVATLPAAPLVTRVSANMTPNGPRRMMTLDAAQMTFTSRDDLSLDLPDDRDQPSIQVLMRIPPGDPTGSAVRREFEGNYSWMCTVVPAVNMNENMALAAGDDLYTVSIVVFYKRRLEIDPSQPQPPERMVATQQVLGGIGGAELRLASPSPTALDEIRPGEWVFLSAYVNGPGTRPVFKWMRVVSVDDSIEAVGPNYYRWVSVNGADWNIGPSEPAPNQGTYVSLFEGAIGVHEQTIRIDGSSMYWQP